ncbi:MAG TPA: hypothetical protein VF487_06060 [Chitinophagaceae bacterium]
MPLQDYSPVEFHPRKLTKEEIEDPYQVIHDFFSYAHLPEIREMLWEFLKTQVSGTFHQKNTRERSNLLYFYERVESMIEAVHLIHKQTNPDKHSKD